MSLSFGTNSEREVSYSLCRSFQGDIDPGKIADSFLAGNQTPDEFITSLVNLMPCKLDRANGCRTHLVSTLDIANIIIDALKERISGSGKEMLIDWMHSRGLEMHIIARNRKLDRINPLKYLLEDSDFFLHPHETYLELLEDVRQLAKAWHMILASTNVH